MDELLARLRSEGEHETYPPASADDLATTERAIERPLPPSLRRFLTLFSNGAYLFTLQEVSAAGAGNRQVAAIQDVVSDAISASPDADVALDSGGTVKAQALVPFSLDHNGNSWCLLTSEDFKRG